MHTHFTHTQDKKLMLLGSITTRSILSRLSTQVQRYLQNVAKPSTYSDSTLATERGEPSTHLDKSSGTKAISFTTDLSRPVALNTSVHLTATYYPSIDIDNGLPYISQVPHTQKEFDELPHVIFSSSAEWDPTVLDNKLSSQPNWFDIVKNDTVLKTDTYVLPLSMLMGTTYTDILTRNPVLVTRRFSTRRSDPFLVSKPTTTMMTTPQ